VTTVRPDLLEDADLPAPFGRYTLLGLLGEGGMARVFKAELQGPSGFRKRAAVKIIHATVAKKSEKLRRALINEARLGGLLHHPNIVDTYEFGEEQGLPFIAMELVRGVGLDVMLELMRPLPPAQALEIAIQICAGLDHAHSLEDDDGEPVLIVHRDLKPSNVLLSRDGLVKVMDFGIAKAATNTYNTTETGMTKGTPAYMSPEQAEGIPLDGRSDIFALGALLYEMVVGERLFRGENMVQVLMSVLRVEQILAEEQRWEWLDATVPGLRDVVTTCLRKDRADRYDDCLEVEAALKALARDMAPPRPLKTTVRELMKEHGLGGGDSSSSVRVAGAGRTPSNISGGAPLAAKASSGPASVSAGPGAVGPTRAQLPATPVAVPAAEVPPTLVQAPATPAAVAAMEAPPQGTLWEGAETQRPPRSKAVVAALGLLLLLGVAGGGYLLGSSGDVEAPAPQPSPAAVAVAPADALSDPVEAAPTPVPARKPAPQAAPKAATPKAKPAPEAEPAAKEPTPKPSAAKPTGGSAVKKPKDPRTKQGAKDGATKAKPTGTKAEVKAASATGAGNRAPAFDPDDPNLVVEYARVRVQDKGDETWSVRFTAKVRGGRDARATVRFNPPGASWVEKSMRTRDDVTFTERVTFRKKNVGKTYWYIEVVGADGTKAGWGSSGDKKQFKIED